MAVEEALQPVCTDCCRRRRTQRLRLAISDAAAPGHVVLAPATIVVLQTAPRRHLRLQALETASRPLPRLVSLLPLVLRQPDSHPEAAAPATANGAQASLRSAGTAEQLVSSAMGSAPGAATVVVGADGLLRLPGFDGGGSAGRWLGAPGTAQLLQLFPAWLAAQAEAAGGALDDAVLLQVPKRSGRTDEFAVCARNRTDQRTLVNTFTRVSRPSNAHSQSRAQQADRSVWRSCRTELSSLCSILQPAPPRTSACSCNRGSFPESTAAA